MQAGIIGSWNPITDWINASPMGVPLKLRSLELPLPFDISDVELLIVHEIAADRVEFARSIGQRASAPVLLFVIESGFDEERDRLHYSAGVGRGVFASPSQGEGFKNELEKATAFALRSRPFRGRKAEGECCQDIPIRSLVTQTQFLFNTLMEMHPDAIYFKDLESRFVIVNRTLVRKSHCNTEQDLLGKCDHDLFGPEHADEALADEQALIKGRMTVVRKVERENWTHGAITWAETIKMPIKLPDGRIIGTFGISRDITNERRMDMKLLRERNLIQTLINLLPARIFVKDTERRYIFNNRRHLEFLGVDSQEAALGRRIDDFKSADRSERVEKDELEVIQNEAMILGREEHDPENNCWMLVSKVPYRDHDGQVAGIVGLSVDITQQKQLEERLKARNRQIESEVALARALQLNFLPQKYPRFEHPEFPEQPLLEFAHNYLPSSTLGGDYLYVNPVGPHQACMLMCDAMGHGVRAALVTAMLQAAVRELASFAGDPGEFLTRLSAILYSSLGAGSQVIFVTAFYAVIDLRTRKVRHSSAGSNYGILLRGHNEIVRLKNTTGYCGPALGLFADSIYESEIFDFLPGDEVLCYTDGVVEASGEDGEFGVERFHRFLIENAHLSLRERFERLIATLKEFVGRDTFEDDVCLLAARMPDWVPAQN